MHPYTIPTSVVKSCREEVENINLSVGAFTIGKRSELTALPGNAHNLPPDLAGYYFVAAALAPAGTQVLNGDGMLYRVHFAGGQATLKSRIAKTPCYYADQIIQRSGKYPKAYHFRDGGPSRSSSKLGNRNQLNTAFLQTYEHFMVTFDVGIPWIVDPDSMELIEPVGKMDEWSSLTEPFLDLVRVIRNVISLSRLTPAHLVGDRYRPAPQNEIFPPHSTPAHPVCDRYRPFLTERGHQDTLISDHFLTLNYSTGYKGKFKKTFDRLLDRLQLWIARRTGRSDKEMSQGLAPAKAENSGRNTQPVYSGRFYGFTDLLRYTFSDRTLERWQLVLPDWNDNNPDIQKLVIGEQSIHQMIVTEDYIILADIAFKIEFSQIFSPSFVDPLEKLLDRIVKVLTSQQTLPQIRLRAGYWLYSRLLQLIPPSQITNFYILKRSDLQDSDNGAGNLRTDPMKSVRVRNLTIPRDVSHFTADYSNSDGKVTLHVGHNNGGDVTEWISKYDQPVKGKLKEKEEKLEQDFQRWLGTSSKSQKKQKKEKEKEKYVNEELGKDFQRLAGMLTGAMDVSSFGRYKIDGETGALLDSKVISDVEHTWWPSVYTHRDVCRDRPSEAETKEIKTMFWVCSGFSWEIVPDRLYQVYKDRDFRVIHHTELKTDKPCKLLRLDTEAMKIVDWFDFPPGHFACSPQFIPKSTPCPENQDLSTHGYIACVVLADQPDAQAGTSNANPKDEFWIFDAANLGNRGDAEQPAIVYKLSRTSCPDPLNLELTIHSIWLSEDDFSKKSQDYRDSNERRNRRKDAFWRDYGALLTDAGDRYSASDKPKPRDLKKVDKTTKALFEKVQKLFIEQTLEPPPDQDYVSLG